MIHYHGLPITPAEACVSAITGGHAFVSFAAPSQIGLAVDVCQSFAIDNGAFSAYNSGKPVTDWTPFYDWVAGLCRIPSFDFAVIPDIVDGDEASNDALLIEWPWQLEKQLGAPVWHMHESIDRFVRLCTQWPRVCIGSSREFKTVGSPAWWHKITIALNAICDIGGHPICKLHGLRMLNPRVFVLLPLSSADSTNIGQNVGIDAHWRGTYLPVNKSARAKVMRERIEAHQSSQRWDFGASTLFRQHI